MITNPQTLTVRIKHKYDSYSAWNTNNPVLERGEIAVVEIPTSSDFTNEPEGSSRLTPPAIGVKIGDGNKRFKELPWIQSTAGDVYAWAKKETLDFSDLSEDLIEELRTALPDTNTQYIFTYADNKIKVQSKEIGQTDPAQFKDVIEFTIDDTSKVSKVAGATAGNLAALTADGQIADSGEKIADFLKSADAEQLYAPIDLEQTVSTLAGRVTALDAEETGRVAVVEKAIEILNGDEKVEGSVKKQVVDEIAKVVDNAPDNFNTLKEIADWIANDQTGAANLANRLTTVEGTVEGHTKDIEGILESLAGVNAPHSHENKAVLDGITAEKVSAWDAAEQAAKDYADGLNNAQTGVVSGIDGRVSALETTVGSVESESGLAYEVELLNGKAHKHTNKLVLDGITEDKVTAWDAAIQAGNGITVTASEGKQVVSSVSTDLLANGAKTLVFECGTSAV